MYVGPVRPPDEYAREAWRRIVRLREKVVTGAVIGDAVDINRIACPLRYDICIRIEFLRLLRDEWTLYEDDLSLFRKRPPAQAYFNWFRNVRCARYQPALMTDAARLEAGFIKRIHQTAQLWQSVKESGFDTSNPIRLWTGRSIRSINGKKITTTLFAGDGCHRIACLYLLGWRYLEPVHYEVVIRPRFKPLDNTALLIDSKALEVSTYLRYISHFYCDGELFDSETAILQYVSDRKPEILPELESALAYDLTRF